MGLEFRRGLAEQFTCPVRPGLGPSVVSAGAELMWRPTVAILLDLAAGQDASSHGIVERMRKPVQIWRKGHRPPTFEITCGHFYYDTLIQSLIHYCSFIRNHKDRTQAILLMPRSYPGQKAQPNPSPLHSQARVAEILQCLGAWVSHLMAAKVADSRKSNRIGF